MKTNKLNKKSATESLVMVAALAAGFMVSGAVDAVVPADKRKIARVGVTGAGTAGAALLPSTTPVRAALKFMSAGAAARGAYNLASDQLKAATTVKADASLAERAYYGAIGLACPGNAMALRSPISYPEINVQTLDTSWVEGSESYEVNTDRFAV